MKPIFVELEALSALISLSPTTIQKMVREGIFSAPRQLWSRRVAWLLREIEEWAENRPISDLPPPPNIGKRRSKAAPPPVDLSDRNHAGTINAST